MPKFKLGDKVMGYESFYHRIPFYGKVINIKSDEGSIYYIITGIFSIENELGGDKHRIVSSWENHLRIYDEDKCNTMFIIYNKIYKCKKQINQLEKEIKSLLDE